MIIIKNFQIKFKTFSKNNKIFNFNLKIVVKYLNLKIVRLDIVRKIEYNKNDRFILWLKYLSAKTKEERESIARGDEVLMELEENINEYLKNADELWWETFNDDYWNKRIYKEYGEELGIEKGKIEGVKETIKNMLQDNMSLEDISKYVNLSEEEIKKMLDENI